MKFKLEFTVEQLNLNLSFEKGVLLIGSCFSDEMGRHFKKSGFQVNDNPFGTLFHPTAIARVLRDSICEETSVDILNRNDLYFSWDSSGKIYANDPESLTELIMDARSELKAVLQDAQIAIVTFGTAWGYKRKESGKVVANCHKVALDQFNKDLSEVNEMIEEWRDLTKLILSFNSELKLIFTVSPVRHVKDGLVENNRSKARLIELVHGLKNERIHYFPSYEILIDELRDYRFYSGDLVHPSEEATSYVWKRFKEFLFDTKTTKAVLEVEKVKSSLAHKSLYPTSEEEFKRKEVLSKEKQRIDSIYPGINWE